MKLPNSVFAVHPVNPVGIPLLLSLGGFASLRDTAVAGSICGAKPQDLLTLTAADSLLGVLGALDFWRTGEHGSPKIDISDYVWFENDHLAVRFIEEIDFPMLISRAR